ncbi:phosphatidylserine decarboxylase [Campylobacter sp. 9BO]|uniref:phosphatidylserine decarboxylase n=1 Tax=Campylobacter sp. 9BO TaxID=3424759 RepID=UPI003D3339A9
MSMDRVFSRYFGLFGKIKFPKAVQTFINEQYIKYFKIDMSEFDKASEYESLNALFTRNFLKEREFDKDRQIFISPCDGICLSSGTTKDGMAFSIKGKTYSLKELLGQSISEVELKNEYDFANIYLSPKDYHHYHAPCDLKILKAVHMGGKLYSVAKKWLEKVDGLYAKNERVALRCQMSNGKLMWLVFVGALNVGKMKFAFDDRIQTNANASQVQVYGYENLYVKKGERLGNFELGSTILIINEKDAIEYNLSEEKQIKQAETIGLVRL